MDKALGIVMGLMMGGTVALATASFWLALNIPMRIQAMLDAGSPKLWTVAITVGLTLGALVGGTSFTLHLPVVGGIIAMCFGGMFVGMLASALGEVLDVVPNMFHRMQLTGNSKLAAWALLIGKALGAVLAAMLLTL